MKAMLLGFAVAIAITAAASGDVLYHEGDSEIGVLLGDATFDGMETGDPLQNYQEDGLTIDVDDVHFDFNPPGFPPEWDGFYYPNAGVGEQIKVTRTDGGDFNVVELNVSNGWGNGQFTYLWIQAFLDGDLLADFDADVSPSGKLVGVTGNFDELRIASYLDAATRDAHNPAELNAIAIDNVAYGLVPEPASLALLALGGIVLLRRR